MDFRIEVREAEHRKEGGFRYEAGEGSRWFNLFDASSYLSRLETIDAKEALSSLLSFPGQPVGQALQSIRQLKDAEALQELEAHVDTIGFDFISYRIADGTRSAYETAIRRLGEGTAIFWDRWSLPRRLAERREAVSDKALDRYLFDRIDLANLVWAVETPKYREQGSYSRTEYERAASLGKIRSP